MRLISMSILVGFLSTLATAQQVPNLINYQGKLTDANNNPLPNGTYMLTFRIYGQAQGGTPIWGPQIFDGSSGPGFQAQVPVINGYFNVMLGPIDTSSRSILTAFTDTPRYLSTAVAGGPEMLPRQMILSAPYAIQALNAPLPNIQWMSNYPPTVFTVPPGGPAKIITGLSTTNFPVRAGNSVRVRMTLQMHVNGSAGALDSQFAIFLGHTQVTNAYYAYYTEFVRAAVVAECLLTPGTLGNTTTDKTVTISGCILGTGNLPMGIDPGNGTMMVEEVLASQISQPTPVTSTNP